MNSDIATVNEWALKNGFLRQLQPLINISTGEPILGFPRKLGDFTTINGRFKIQHLYLPVYAIQFQR